MPDEIQASQSSSNATEPAMGAGSALLVPPLGESARETAHPGPKALAEASPLVGLPMQLDVIIPVPSFRVQDLLALEKGAVLESQWPQGDDVPVWCGKSQLVWSEFEVVDQKLAVRVTRLG